MANTKISALPSNNNPTGSEELVYAYNNSNGKMTLNTMKTFASSDSQPTLVSGTNIKTINNQSILWAWNIDIQWGWGGGWEWYDAIVDASGGWDYTTIGAAVDANKRNIFVMNWTYNETQWHFITMSAVDKIVIHWQSSVWVVVNLTLTSVPTQWSDYYNYPAFLFLNTSTTDKAEVEIKNITFNLSVNTDQRQTFIIRWNWKNAWYADILIDNCVVNVSNDWSNMAWFETIWYKTEPKWIVDITNCSFFSVSNTANMRFGGNESILNNENKWSTYKNCYFSISANNNNWWVANIRNVYDSIVKFDTTNMWSISFSWRTLERCDIDVWANISQTVPITATLVDVRNCAFEWRHEGQFSPINIWVNSIVPDWQESTSYSVWNQVYYEYAFYQCKTAHTSSDSFLRDEDNWTPIATVEIQDAVWCSFYTSETISLLWTIKSNSFKFNNAWDVLLSWRCIMEWNFIEDDTYYHNIYVNNHNIVNSNILWWYKYASDRISIKYVSTYQNIIVNNMLYNTAQISKIWTWSKGIVDNNSSWS